jgi:hypothetical protein
MDGQNQEHAKIVKKSEHDPSILDELKTSLQKVADKHKNIHPQMSLLELFPNAYVLNEEETKRFNDAILRDY